MATALCLFVLLGGNALLQSTKKARPFDSELVLVQHVETVGDSAKEPTIVEAPDGTLFVSGFGKLADGQPQELPRLWESTDHGETWTSVNMGRVGDGATGNSDVSLAVARDGTLYLVQLEFDPKALEGVHIVAGISSDLGVTWRWTTLTKGHFVDRPWIAVAPEGTAHVIWSDADGVHHIMSHDDGRTWSAPQALCASGGSSHLAVGPHGEVAVRVTPSFAGGLKFNAAADFIVVSTDGGRTWQNRPPPGYRDWSPNGTDGSTPRWVEPVAWDSKGHLYSLWINFKGVWLARSVDAGITWHKWHVADIGALSYYPYLTAQGDSELAATWFSGAADALQWHLVRIGIGNREVQPRVMQRSGLTTDSWIESTETSSPVRDTAGEYLSVLFLRNGDLAVVSPIQNPKAKQFGFSFWRFRTPEPWVRQRSQGSLFEWVCNRIAGALDHSRCVAQSRHIVTDS